MSLKLHPGERVLVCYGRVDRHVFVPDCAVRAVVDRVEPLVCARVVSRGKGLAGLITIYDTDEEGIWWARGWNTKAARALRVSVALAAA